MPRRTSLLLALLIAPTLAVAAEQTPATPSLEEVLSRAGDAVASYYQRAQSIMSTETVVQQELNSDLSPVSMAFPRRLVYERRIEWDAIGEDGAPVARIQRELIKANNRAPKPKDKPKCFDKEESTPDLAQMLLPANRDDYVFRLAKPGRSENRPAVIVEFEEKARPQSKVTAVAKEGVDDCYSIPDEGMNGQFRGRIWLSPDTYDVLQIDLRLKGPVDVSARTRGRRPFDTTWERSETSTVYRPVTFDDPAETLILPASIVRLHVQSGNSYRQREITTFTGYRRFVTDGRIVER